MPIGGTSETGPDRQNGIAPPCAALRLAVKRGREAFERLTIRPPAGLRPAGGPILMFSRLESGRNPARKNDLRCGSTIGMISEAGPYPLYGAPIVTPYGKDHCQWWCLRFLR